MVINFAIFVLDLPDSAIAIHGVNIPNPITMNAYHLLGSELPAPHLPFDTASQVCHHF
jgi:hypothetical protein